MFTALSRTNLELILLKAEVVKNRSSRVRIILKKTPDITCAELGFLTYARPRLEYTAVTDQQSTLSSIRQRTLFNWQQSQYVIYCIFFCTAVQGRSFDIQYIHFIHIPARWLFWGAEE